MNYEEILVEKEAGVCTIILNRPEKLNALTTLTRIELIEALLDADSDDNVRVVIITGAGNGFCSGSDVSTVVSGKAVTFDEPKRALLMKSTTTERVVEAIHNLTKPTVCAMNGVAAGGGADIALACDILLASDKARFRIAYTRIGTAPGEGISFDLPRRIGIHRTLELVYTNDVIDAREMDRIGMVNKVVTHDELMKTARDMAKRMFEMPPIGLALAKKAIYHGATVSSPEEQVVFDIAMARTLAQTEDAREARASLLEKRKPIYKGK